MLGQLVSVQPTQLVADKLAKDVLTRSDQLSEHIGQDVTLAGIRLAVHRFASKQESMWLVDMEDAYGVYQVLWSGATLKRFRPMLSQREPLFIRGRVRTDRQGQVILIGIEIQGDA